MRLTRSIALAAAMTAAAGSAFAGGFAPVVPVAEPVVVVEPTAPRSSFGLVLPLVLLGGDHWRRTLPAWPLLEALARDSPMAGAVHVVDDLDEALALVTG